MRATLIIEYIKRKKSQGTAMMPWDLLFLLVALPVSFQPLGFVRSKRDWPVAHATRGLLPSFMVYLFLNLVSGDF